MPMKKSTQRLFELMFLVFAASFALGHLQRVELGNLGSVYFHDLVILVWLLGSITLLETRMIVASGVNSFFTRLKVHKFWKPLVFFVGWAFLGIAIHTLTAGDIQPWLYLFRIVVYIAFGLSTVWLLPAGEQVYFWLFPSVLMTFLALLQYIFLPDLRFLTVLGWDDHYFRLAGTLFDPQFTGMIMVLIVAFALASPPKKEFFWLPKLALILAMPAIILTYSRSTYLALLILVTIGLLGRGIKPKHLLILGVLLFFGLQIFLLAPKPGGLGVNLLRTETIQARIENSQRSLSTMLPHHWLIGRGLFAPLPNSEHSQAKFPDNLLVMMLTATGIPGLFAFFILAVRSAGLLAAKNKWLLAAFLALLTHSQFNNTLLQPFIFLFSIGGFASLFSTKKISH
jgi:hypothetical protein